jgi:predicted nucleotidyltransferase
VSLPDFTSDGSLPPGIHAASLTEVQARFGTGSEARQRQMELLRQVVEAARFYPTIKRILLWGSFVTVKADPADLDYSIVVSVIHERTAIAAEHRRFLLPTDARRHYGVDRKYLVIKDYPLDSYIDRLDFICHDRNGRPCGILEVNLFGEFLGEE